MSDTIYYAHSLPGEPEERWETLEDHLREVAVLAGEFAARFGASEWGELAGWWHDLGKYKPEFQARLRGSREHAPHAGVGAALAASRGQLGQALAFVIAGHHAGLANLGAQGDSAQIPLRERIVQSAPDLETVASLAPDDLLARPLPETPARFLPDGASRSERQRTARSMEWWIRTLFSALVDADFLATERFYDPEKRRSARRFDSISDLTRNLDNSLAAFRADTPVNQLRHRVLAACRAAAGMRPGLFSLTVPTGGGKTLSSLAFALRHAGTYGMRRVIVVIPYTSIIEQNARVYREVLGESNVIEHHSNIDEVDRLKENPEIEIGRRLAAENWDAPVVVTTNVQFFESLFANRPGRCRKLHNIARSVIVLDEAQSLPAQFLDCALDALRELTANYACSVVLMTATQPALQRRESLPAGLEDVHEIIPDREHLAKELERVTIHWPKHDTPPRSYGEIARSMCGHDQALTIVHLRKDARRLAEELPAGKRLHLSALMCAAHRTEVLREARARLTEGKPCLLVSTQLIEAGVDISFPIVFRALAGLDSLAQAAGRCNREGELLDLDGNQRRGDVHVFRAETRPPPGILRMGLEATEALLRLHGDKLSFSDAAFLDEYFRMLYGKCETDAKGVQAERTQLNFATVALRVRLIEDGFSQPVVVPWGDSEARVAAFQARPGRGTQRALQPYVVQIPTRDVERLSRMGALEWINESIHAVTPAFYGMYDREFGVAVDESTPEPAALIA